MQQQLASTATQIPDDIARLAHEQQLGTPQASYVISKLSRGWRWSLFLFPFSISIMIGSFTMLPIAFILFPVDSFAFIFFIIWAITFYLSLIINIAVLNFINKFCTIYPCDKGFILKQSTTKYRVIRWDEIETIWSTTARLPTRLYIKSKLYSIRCHDGETLTLNDRYKVRNNAGRLNRMFKEHFIRRRLPFQFAAFQAGQTLNFDPVRINRNGISMQDKILPWEQVADISLLKDRRLVIYKTGEQPEIWLNLPAFKIPNQSILLALFKRIRGGQSEQETGFEALAAYGTAVTIVQSRGKIDALPEELAALAEEHRLGERRLDQKLGSKHIANWPMFLALFIMGTLSIGFMSWVFSLTSPGIYDSDWMQISLTIIKSGGIAFVIIFYLALLLRGLWHLPNSTYTFERGLIFIRGKQMPVVCRWDEIETIKHTYTLNKSMAHRVGMSNAYTIQRRDGFKLTLSALDIYLPSLSTIIKEQIVPLQLPAAVTAFQEAQTLTFGPVRVNQQGIALNKRQIPWSQIKSVALEGNQLVIYDITQRKPWSRLLVTRIPNLFLLFALADYARDISR